MLSLSTHAKTRELRPIDLVFEAFADSALELTPREAVARLNEPKDHLSPEDAEFVDDLMRWVIQLDRERTDAAL